jgi:hypothetical protein
MERMADASGRISTSTRNAIRVVLRGLPLPEGGHFTIGDLRVLVIARAKPTDWPDTELQKGDLDGVVWVGPEDAFTAAAALQADSHIVAVRVDVVG